MLLSLVLFAQQEIGDLSSVDETADSLTEVKGNGRSFWKEGLVDIGSGRLEFTGIHGRIPFTASSGDAWNWMLKGDVTLELLGLPLGLSMDLGTDQPIRGQRNRFRLAFDPRRMVDSKAIDRADRLRSMDLQMDSLAVLEAQVQRRLSGELLRLRGMGTLAVPEEPMVPGSPALPDGGALRLTLPSDTVLSVRAPVGAMAKQDSVRQLLSDLEDRLAQVRKLLGILKTRKDALSMPELEAPGSRSFGGVARSLRRFEVGTYAPMGSEFLLHGIVLQGAGVAVEHRGLHIAVDHGRSLDDRWRETDPVARDLRRLQESLFLLDVRDMAPRKLTAVKVGCGALDRSYFRVGLLKAERELPGQLGALLNNDGTTIRNHVVELDMGVAVKAGHRVRFVLARSMLDGYATLSDDQDRRAGFPFGDRSNEQAAKLMWTSELRKLRTRVDLEGRLIGPDFQSFGMGYIRNGSRAWEAKVTQSIGKRLRARFRVIADERTTVARDGHRVTDLLRGQLQVSYRLDRHFSLKAMYGPATTYTRVSEGEAVGGMNRTASVGVDGRKRVGAHTLTGLLSMGVYGWRTHDQQEQFAVDRNVMVELAGAAGWVLALNWTDLQQPEGNSGKQHTSNLGMRAGYRVGEKWSTNGALQYTNEYGAAYSMDATFRMRFGLSIGARAERYVRNDILFDQAIYSEGDKSLTCSLRIGYQW